MDTTEKNSPTDYTNNESIDLSRLKDSDPNTALEIDPYVLGIQDISYTFDLGRVYARGTLLPNIGYYTLGRVRVMISTDDISYIPVNMNDVGDFDFRYLRVIFEKIVTQNDITLFHTLTFYKKVQSRYLVESQ
jgi:hypothetical protein